MAQRKRPARRASKNDAVKVLIADHTKVKKLFKEFERLEGDTREKAELVRKICMELIIHTRVEEEILYPALRESIDDEDMMDEADVEHAGAKSLISELAKMRPGEDHYDAKVTVLGEYIDHHVKEEQDEMFPKARRAKLDLQELGARILQRKEELQADSRLLA